MAGYKATLRRYQKTAAVVAEMAPRMGKTTGQRSCATLVVSSSYYYSLGARAHSIVFSNLENLNDFARYFRPFRLPLAELPCRRP